MSVLVKTKKKPTLKTLAMALNLSPAAISYILNGKGKDIKISDDTIARVKAYANKMNYRPHSQARNLRMGRTGILGLCMEFPDPVTGDLMYKLFRGISSAAMHHNRTIMIMDLDQEEVDEVTALERLVNGNVDGIIAAYRENPAYLQKINELVASGHKIVMALDHYGVCNCPSIDVDHKASAKRAVKYLQDKGYSRIAHLGNDEQDSVGMFIARGWVEQLAAAGMKPDGLYFRGHDTVLDFGVKQLLASPELPDAIFCWNDKSAAAIHHALNEAGLDIEIMGYDNRAFVYYLNKPFNSVDYPLEEIGKTAVETLLSEDLSKRNIKIEAKIIEREKG
jgi:LacI family transcriptional regulator, galactose operon repressor